MNGSRITFRQSKTRKLQKETVITYSESIMKTLRAYIGERQGHVFVTRSGKLVMINQVAITFAKAGKAAGIPFKVSPHVLRASAVIPKQPQKLAGRRVQSAENQRSQLTLY